MRLDEPRSIDKKNISNEWNTYKKPELSLSIKISLIIIQIIQTTNAYFFNLFLIIILYIINMLNLMIIDIFCIQSTRDKKRPSLLPRSHKQGIIFFRNVVQRYCVRT